MNLYKEQISYYYNNNTNYQEIDENNNKKNQKMTHYNPYKIILNFNTYNLYNTNILKYIFLYKIQVDYININRIVNFPFLYKLFYDFRIIWMFKNKKIEKYMYENIDNITTDKFIEYKNLFMSLYKDTFSISENNHILDIIQSIDLDSIQNFKNTSNSKILEQIFDLFKFNIYNEDITNINNLYNNGNIIIKNSSNLIENYNFNYMSYLIKINFKNINSKYLLELFSIVYFLYEKKNEKFLDYIYNTIQNKFINDINHKKLSYIVDLLELLHNPTKIYSYYDYIENFLDIQLLKTSFYDESNNEPDIYNVYKPNLCFNNINYYYFDYYNKKPVNNFLIFKNLFKNHKDYIYTSENIKTSDLPMKWSKTSYIEQKLDIQKKYFLYNFIQYIRLKNISEKYKISRDIFYEKYIFPLLEKLCLEIFKNVENILLLKNLDLYDKFLEYTINYPNRDIKLSKLLSEQKL